MRVISVPARLRLAASLLLLCVPIAALETVIVTHSPWWRLPYDSIRSWCLAIALIILPVIAWLQSGIRAAFHFATAFATAWIALSAWTAIRLHQPALGFFTLFLIVYFGTTLAWLRRELDRSFFDPRVRWYEGAPKAIPGLGCTLNDGKGDRDLRVSRIDSEGIFVFADPSGRAISPLRAERMRLSIRFRDQKLRSEAFPVRWLRDGQGAGLQFRGLTPDQRKELGDFVEILKGEGYVE